jgi:hypothetical protein
MLTYLENFIRSPEDLKEIEGKLCDYENLIQLVDMMKSIFDEIVRRVDVTGSMKISKEEPAQKENYQLLEKVAQKHEGEIRNHIRVASSQWSA